MNKQPCDICDSGKSTPIDADPRVHVCDECGFVYVPERRPPDKIAADWDWVYSKGHYDPTWPGVRARLFYVAEWLDQHIGLDGKSVLDIGAGDGFFLDQIRQRGAHPVGLEAFVANVDKIRAQDIFCHHGTVESIGNIGQFDLVTFNWCLENNGSLKNPLEFARDALNPDGLVSVATGSRILSGFRKPITSYFNPDLPADLHCFHFDIIGLSEALIVHGLSPIKWNDYRQNDVMLELAGRSVIRRPVPSNDPAHARGFFKDWQKCPWV